ncbi:MAG: ASKHA domain-containing protein [Methanolobus sp.]
MLQVLHGCGQGTPGGYVVLSDVDEVIQIGNTSLIVAREILLSEDRLWELQDIAVKIVSNHVMFATDPAFKEAYIQEISYWTEGMPFKMLKKFLKKKGL